MHQSNPGTFHAIADPSRRRILMLLSQEHLTVNALAENFDMSRPAVSKHIRILHEAGFISIEERGRERICSLREEGFDELKEWVEYFEAFWSKRVKKLGKLLERRASGKR